MVADGNIRSAGQPVLFPRPSNTAILSDTQGTLRRITKWWYLMIWNDSVLLWSNEKTNTPSINIILILFFYIVLHHLRFDGGSFAWPSSSAIIKWYLTGELAA